MSSHQPNLQKAESQDDVVPVVVASSATPDEKSNNNNGNENKNNNNKKEVTPSAVAVAVTTTTVVPQQQQQLLTCGICMEEFPVSEMATLICCKQQLCLQDVQRVGQCPYCRREPSFWIPGAG